VRQQDDFVRVTQPVEAATGIEKEIDIKLFDGETRVQLTHRLRNHNLWAVELSPWSLSVMAGGGRAVVPLPARGEHPKDLLPTGLIVIWPYVDMRDERWMWGREFVLLRQTVGASPQKIGSGPEGWLAYANHGNLFVKTYNPMPGAAYPDFGSAVEVFTNEAMLELETLGPVTKLEPGAVVEHVENWYLFRDVPEPQNDDEVKQDVLPKVQQARAGS
jgi:hypothetical protein